MPKLTKCEIAKRGSLRI